jgi:uncharacterized protein DUF4159
VSNWSKVAVKWVSLAVALALMGLSVSADVHNEDNAGFRFARLQYPGGIPDYIKNWYTDYPMMDFHLSRYLGLHTRIDVGSSTLVEPSSPKLFGYPLIYSVEPEQMVLGPHDAANLREYLERGGFWFADDFHGDREFGDFLEQLRLVMPGAQPVELKTSHPLFHSFYDIEQIIQVTNDGIARCRECDQWENGPSGKIPRVFALFDSHDRICVLMAWNTDLGDGLEWADDPTYPQAYSAYASKFLTNVVVYAMTH